MKKINYLLSLIIFVILAGYSALAIPADNTQIFSKKQSNGKIISYTLNGDEFISWARSLDGYTLFEKNNGDIVYAIINEDGLLVKSNVLACDYQYRTIEDNIFLSTIKKELFYNSSQIEQFRQKRTQRYSSNSRSNIPTIGTPNFLVILVSFTDIPFNSTNATTMQNQISQTNYTANGATGSVKDYFYDNSMGTLNANFTVVGPYTLSHNQAYYGAETEYDNDSLPREMIAEACSLANQDVNFANFDNDNDGYIDMIHVIYAGRGQHNGGGTDAIWAHSWTLPTLPSFDGVNAYRYSCSNELRTTTSVDGIGTICHEMGHVLGLPDFYDTDYDGSGGQAIHLSSWDLMAGGSYNNSSKTPPYLSALERQMLGWLTPITLTANTSNCTLPAISDSNKAYKVALSTNEFFMFEHRNKKKWDAYTSAKGMLVFHGDNSLINHWVNSRINDINVDPYDRGYFIIPASGDSTNINSTSTTFPGSTNQTTFINSTLKNGTPTGKSLIGIAYGADSVITFSYVNNAPTITMLPPTNITTTSATLNGTVTGTGINSKGFEYRTLGTTNFTQQAVTNNPLQLTLNNLLVNTTYEYRIYVTTSYGTIYSPIETFSTDCGTTLNIPFTETFETSLTCWNQISSDTNHFNFVSTGSNPTCSPHSGTRMLRYNSYLIPSDRWTALISPKISFPSHLYNVNFWIYRNYSNYSDPEEGVEVYINSSPSLNSATLIGFISNDRTATPTMSINNWYNYSCNVPPLTYGNHHIILKAISKYGNNIYIDDVSVSLSQNVPPVITYEYTTNITHNSADLVGGYIQGSESISSYGFKYRKTSQTTWTTIELGPSTPFLASVNNLTPNSIYQVKSYASTQSGTIFESTIDTFSTLQVTQPIVSTDSSSLNSPTSAILYGSYEAGSLTILSCGFQYKKSSDNSWTSINQQSNTSPFSNIITNLAPNSTYNYRAFITNYDGFFTGETKYFTTSSSQITLGEVNTTSAQIISDSISLIGELINTGNATSNIEIGFVLSENPNPLIGDNLTQKYIYTGSINPSSYYVNIPTPCNYYPKFYFKAYITNQAGTSYGNEIEFTCLSIEDVENKNPLRILLYPNPTHSLSNLKIENIYGNLLIRITDTKGRVLQKFEDKVNDKYEIQINLSNYSKGVYFINIITDDYQRTEKLILK